MHLITEYTDNIEYLVEARAGHVPSHYIKGVFLQADVKNHNGRVYPKDQLRSSVDQYIDEQVLQDRAVGELTHPDSPIVDYNKVSHKITELHWEGSEVIGTAKVLNTPCGKILKELIDGEVKIGVSSRGVGNITERSDSAYVSDFSLRAVDVVHNPSAPDAFVRGILESQEWFWTEQGELTMQKTRKRAKQEQLLEQLKTEHQLQLFNKWIESL